MIGQVVVRLDEQSADEQRADEEGVVAAEHHHQAHELHEM